MKIKVYFSMIFSILAFGACEEDVVVFDATNHFFQSIQIQKFDYVSRNGVGKIYPGQYSANRDTVYFHITHYPDEVAATTEDWKIQATLPQGVRVTPGLEGVLNLAKPLQHTLWAADGQHQQEVVLKMLIYEVPYGELDYGVGRYSKLFERSVAELGVSASAKTIAVVEDYLLLNDGGQGLTVLNKITGAKVNMNVAMPPNFEVNYLFTDEQGILHASNRPSVGSSSSGVLSVYRWTQGLQQAPELLANVQLPLSATNGWIGRAAIKGSTAAEAMLMFEVGAASGHTSALSIPVVGGKIGTPAYFNKFVSTSWNAKVLPLSTTQTVPFVAVGMGFPAAIMYQGQAGAQLFNVSGSSNFYNFLTPAAFHFEFNNASYLATSTVNWGSDYKMLLLNIDDPSIIPSTKDNPAAYDVLNPVAENLSFKDVSNSGDLTVQVSADGKKAYMYVLATGAGVAAYEFTNIGSKK